MANREELGANEAKITSQDFPDYNEQSKSKWEGGGKTLLELLLKLVNRHSNYRPIQVYFGSVSLPWNQTKPFIGNINKTKPFMNSQVI